VAGQPYLSDRHIGQQESLAAMIAERFGDDPRVAYVNFGDVISLTDRDLSYDGMHLTPDGNALMGSRLVGPVLELAGR
jgi:hypothetical protein